MKFIFILILLFFAVLVFSQNQTGFIIPPSRLNDTIVQHPASERSAFPFLIRSVVPYNNYFAGGKYLFEKWVKGRVMTANNKLIEGDSCFFNYNKISQNLFLTTDFKEVLEVDRREFKSFTLEDGVDEYRFEHEFIINNHQLFQVLVKNNRYSLYKAIITKLIYKPMKSDNFLVSPEFADVYRYYVVFPGGRFYKKVRLKKKSIIKNLVADLEKVGDYFSAHEQESVDEALLINLLNFLNN